MEASTPAYLGIGAAKIAKGGFRDGLQVGGSRHLIWQILDCALKALSVGRVYLRLQLRHLQSNAVSKSETLTISLSAPRCALECALRALSVDCVNHKLQQRHAQSNGVSMSDIPAMLSEHANVKI